MISERELREYVGGSGGPDAVPRTSWDDHYAWMAEHWEAGQHVSILAPTGRGKTYLIREGLLPLWQRYPVLWLQFKPRDSTLRGLGHRVKSFPTGLQRAKYSSRPMDSELWETDPEWFVLRIPEYRWSADGKRQSSSWTQARRIMGEAIDRAHHEGGWVLVVDEVRAISGTTSPHLDLDDLLENSWQRGRSQPLTVIGATQAPVQAPSSFYDQPSYLYHRRMLDARRNRRRGEIGGQTDVIMEVLPTLKEYEFLFVDKEGDSGLMEIVRVE